MNENADLVAGRAVLSYRRDDGLRPRGQAVLTGRLLLCLLLASALMLVLLAVRMHYTNGGRHLSLVWDLFLAWIPVLPAWLLWWLKPSPRKSSLVLSLGLGALWLVFFPNSPYLVTEFVHLHGELTSGKNPIPYWLKPWVGGDGVRRPPALWGEFLLLAVTAATGILLTFTSLRLVHVAVQRRTGPRRAALISALFLFMAGLGIWLGRIIRLNSWDAWERPRLVYRIVRDQVKHAFQEPAVPVSALVTGLILWLMYVGVRELGRSWK